MAEIQALRGIRYDLGQVGALSDVVAPPYDVISPAMQDALYKQHPANCVRLILNRDEPGDDAASNKYSRAARFLRTWKEEGVLFTEPEAALYVYHQQYEYAGQSFNRRGFICRLKLERFGQGRVYPHEETMSGPKQDRLLLTRACQANLSPVFGLYPDPGSAIQEALDAATHAQPPLQCVDHLGVVHKMWPVTRSDVILAAVRGMTDLPIYIADGHHRYETACNYRDELASAGKLTPGHAANYVLITNIGMHDPGLLVLPTHRLFQGLPSMTAADLAAKLGDCFTTEAAGQGPERAPAVWAQIESSGEQGKIGLFTAADNRWTIATITSAGQAKLAQVAPEHSDDWRGLGVAILHRLLIETLLGATDLPKPTYVHLVEEVVEGLQAGGYPLSALVMPATVEHIRAISQSGERMPAKSTYFYPKLLSGLVIHDLTENK